MFCFQEKNKYFQIQLGPDENSTQKATPRGMNSFGEFSLTIQVCLMDT